MCSVEEVLVAIVDAWVCLLVEATSLEAEHLGAVEVAVEQVKQPLSNGVCVCPYRLPND